jgi:hypothetical protein
MTTASSPVPTAGNSSAFPRWRLISYWVATVFTAGNAAVAGAMDILRMQPLFAMLLGLGYPAYFAAILGTWKVLGAVALVAPRRPLLKEWAYAGMFIDFTAAIISYVAVGEGCTANLIGPIMSIGFLVVSWTLRPSSRRLTAG